MSGSGWRLPALAVVVALIVLVGVARLGIKEAPGPLPSPAAGDSPSPPIAALQATPSSAQLSPQPGRVPVVVRVPSDLEFDYSPWPDRYADGIPRSLNGTAVHRLNAALDLAREADGGQTDPILVGAWFAGTPDGASGCSAQGYEPWCRQSRLADTPALLGRDDTVEVSDMPALGAGPVVVSAVVTATCPDKSPWISPAGCAFAVRAQAVLWQGDAYTDAAPIAVGPLITMLASMMWFDPIPYHDKPTCESARPTQAYRTTYGDIQMLFIFPTTADRLEHLTAVLNSPTGDVAATGCVTMSPLDAGNAWIHRANVMMRVVDYAGESGQTIRDLLEQMAPSANQ